MRVEFSFIKVILFLSVPVIFAAENSSEATDELIFVHIVSEVHFKTVRLIIRLNFLVV